jgi:hypothetical protein
MELLIVLNRGLDGGQLSHDDHIKFTRLRDALTSHTADKAWMLDVIGRLTEGSHQFFSKSYVRPSRSKVKVPIVVEGDE